MKQSSVELTAGQLSNLTLPRVSGLPDLAGRTGINEMLSISTVVREGQQLTWKDVVSTIDMLFPFIEHTFTSAGVSGRTGPTLAQCRTAYPNPVWVWNTDFFNVVGGIQKFLVPADGLYEITARGGCNGANQKGAIVKCRINLAKNEQLSILVGQVGTDTTGGCGGTFIVSDERGPLVIAGGAGGFRVTSNSSTDANLATNLGFTGGTGASIYTPGWGDMACGGGAGFTGNGTKGNNVALSFQNGGVGGIGTSLSSNGSSGGFGGGGGGCWRSEPVQSAGGGGGGGAKGGNGAIASNYFVSAFGGSCYLREGVTNTELSLTTTEISGNAKIKLIQFT